MTESMAQNALYKTLPVLARQAGLTPAEIAQLRLAHLHLAGKNPHISFDPVEGEPAKTVELDLEAHRALVGWLVARPDSKGDFLFPGEGADPMAVARIEGIVEGVSPAAPAAEPPADAAPEPPPADQTMVSPAPFQPRPPFSRPEPLPPSRPEMGPPPKPGGRGEATMVSRPPVPEVDSGVSIPLPTSAPKSPAPLPEQESAADEPEPADDSPTEQTIAAPLPSPAAEPPPPAPLNQAQRSAPKIPAKKPPKPGKPAKKLTAAQAANKTGPARVKAISPRLLIPAAALVVLILCGGCVVGGWLATQSPVGRELLTQFGLLEIAAISPETDIPPAEPSPTPDAVEFESPLPSPTLPPTFTPTLLPTYTPAPPTDTPTPIPTDTPLPVVTDTPSAPDTPVPAPVEPADTPLPAPAEPTDTPVPAEPPTPAVKYAAPTLLEPTDNFSFIQGNTIVLRWEPVGELASDEQYAVRLVYLFENRPTYQGTNIKETEWTIPLSLFGQIDGPDYLYEWYVQVERVNDDGSGTAISPESEHRKFTWR